MSYKIWPTASGYCVIDSGTQAPVTDSMDKRAAMRTAHQYNVNGLPSAKASKVVEELTLAATEEAEVSNPEPQKRGRKKTR